MSYLSDLVNDNIKPLPPEAFQRSVVCLNPMQKGCESDSDESDYDSDMELCQESELQSYRSESRISGSICNVTDIGSVHSDNIIPQLTLPVAFTKYSFSVNHRNELPIDEFKTKILNALMRSSVLIIQGPTGCGKTTQVPQFLLDSCKEKKSPCKIVVTQPRRIAAINVAKRVCFERGWSLGTVCGYQIGLDKCVEEESVLTYVTTEVLLQKLISRGNLNDYTHIVVDEVHERTKGLDFLLLIIRKFLFSNSPRVKIILMSATMEADEFAYYFRTVIRSRDDYFEAPIIKVDKKSNFSINTFYFNDLIQFVGSYPDFDINNPGIDEESYRACCLLIDLFKNLDDTDPNTGEKIIGSVLIFLPGINEIEKLHNYLDAVPASKSWDIVPMHSSLPADQLSKVFIKPKKGIRKVILATNIAESSITVPDVTYVIDFCLTKTMVMNSETKFSSLRLEWASHKNCIQRAGRVGRVSNGRVYRLVSRQFYKSEMKANSVPEMQRAPLENIILYMKRLKMNDTPKNVLSLALNPPKIRDVDACIWHLKEIGALLQTVSGKKNMQDGDVTFLGQVMAALPIDVHLSKLIVLGHMFNCLNEAVIMATGCTVPNLFVTPYKEKIEVYKKKLLYDDGSKSDLIALLNLYNVWQSMKREHRFNSGRDEYNWCRLNYIHYKGLKEWEILIKEIHNRLKSFNIEVVPGRNRNEVLTDFEKPTVLKVIICGAFYPNYFARSNEKGQVDMKEAAKMLNDRDPFSNVYFTNMRKHHPGQLYVRQIKKMMDCENISVGFDTENSNKIFVEFKSLKNIETIQFNNNPMVTTFSNNIPDEVYIAIMKRKLNIPFILKIMPDEKAWRFCKEIENKQCVKDDDDSKSDDVGCYEVSHFSAIPPLDIEYLPVTISMLIDAGHFYCHNANDETQSLLMKIDRILNDPGCKFQPIDKANIEVQNKIYVAKYKDDGLYYRCRITGLMKDQRGGKKAHILFIDYGNTDTVSLENIYELPSKSILQVPNIAFCCILSEIQPSLAYSPKGIWSSRVNKFFANLTENVLLHAKVYSVVDDVVHVELFSLNDNKKSINQILVEKNYAVKCEESYLSKADHERRQQVLHSDNPNSEAIRLKENKTNDFIDYDEPDKMDLAEEIVLKGPYSPLETNFYGLMRSITSTSISFEKDSINSVFLDDYPQDPSIRLIVAGVVGENVNKNIILGQTTIMPNIPGFAAMMTLAFCPNVDYKINSDGTKIGSVLCGLGCREKSDKACYPEHDICLNMDVELNKDLILKINELRHAMNAGLKNMEMIFEELRFKSEFAECQSQIKKTLFELLCLKKEPMEPIFVNYRDVWMKTECDFLEVCKMKDQDNGDEVWPLLYFVYLNAETENTSSLKRNQEELLQIAKGLMPFRLISCELCNKELIGLGRVRAHLVNEKHKENVNAFERKLEEQKF